MRNALWLMVAVGCAAPDGTRLVSSELAGLGTETTIELFEGDNDVTYDGTDTWMHLDPDEGAVLIGLDSGYAGGGYAAYLHNASSTISIEIAHLSMSAGAGNGIEIPGGASFTLTPGRSIMVVYSGSSPTGHWLAYLMGESPGSGPTGLTGSTGATGATGAAGAGFGTISTSSPGRSLNSNFTPGNGTTPTWVSYSVRIASSITLTTGAGGRVELLVDSGTPATVRARCAGGTTGTLAIGLALTNVVECQLTYLVPTGQSVQLRSVDETGTPTYTITAVSEQTL